MRRYLSDNMRRELAFLMALVFCVSALQASFPTELIKKIVKGSSPQAKQTSQDTPTEGPSATADAADGSGESSAKPKPAIDYTKNLTSVYVISNQDGDLRRCRGFVVANGVVAVPISGLGGTIKEAKIFFSGGTFPVTASYYDRPSGLALLFTDSEVSPVGAFAYGSFPESGQRVRLASPTPRLGVVRPHDSAVAITRPAKLLGDVEGYDFVSYGILDKDQNLIGVVADCERVITDDLQTSICHIVPGGYIAKMLQESDKGKESIKPLGKASLLAKMSPEELKMFFDAEDMIAMQNYKPAIQALSLLVRTSPINGFVYKTLGDMYYDQGDFKRAEKFYTKAIEIDGNLIGCYPLLADAMSRQGRNAQALEMLDKYSADAKGERLRETFGLTYKAIALKLIHVRDYDNALRALRKAEIFKPDDSEVSFALGEVLLNEGKDYYPEAIAAYKRYIALAGPAWSEFTRRSNIEGDAVTDPRVLKAKRRIADMKHKLHVAKTE